MKSNTLTALAMIISIFASGPTLVYKAEIRVGSGGNVVLQAEAVIEVREIGRTGDTLWVYISLRIVEAHPPESSYQAATLLATLAGLHNGIRGYPERGWPIGLVPLYHPPQRLPEGATVYKRLGGLHYTLRYDPETGWLREAVIQGPRLGRTIEVRVELAGVHSRRGPTGAHGVLALLGLTAAASAAVLATTTLATRATAR